MALSFKFYHDSGLTQEVTSGNPISALQDVDNSLAPVDVQVWFGSTTASRKVQALSDPGVDQITLSINDSVGGQSASAITLALTSGGLAAATPGASLDLGTTVLSGSGNAVSFWMRINDTTMAVGTYTDVYPVTNNLEETAV